jgi:serine phosphatase RsbU (regulator of sigma subunit)
MNSQNKGRDRQELTDRINLALTKEEARAEHFANNIRLVLLMVLSIVALVNSPSVSIKANILNFGTLAVGYIYGAIVAFRIHKSGYHPLMKYITSCLDVVLVFLLLLMYTRITAPSVALKNYVFLIVFPIIALTAFRYDRLLTMIAGGLAIILYSGLIIVLCLTKSVIITNGGYDQELFSGDVTYIGQVTKILILGGYVLLLAYLAKYSRKLFAKLITHELNLRQQKELIDWEMKIASQVQTKLQPNAFPDINKLDIYATVKQGKYVGGDYCDFIKLNDEVALMVIADVSGKGVPAALIMAEVRASIQILASMNIELESLTQRLNTLIYHSTAKKDFVTFFAALIDTLRGVITYVNAGHPPPLLYLREHIRRLSQRTIPLGCQESLPHLHKIEEEFPVGSTLVAYTDGLLEQSDQYGEQYGEERLKKFVHINSDLDVQPFTLQLLEEVRNFGQGKELQDDIGIAAVKFSGI